jgi:hypothetical protein
MSDFGFGGGVGEFEVVDGIFGGPLKGWDMITVLHCIYCQSELWI